MPPDHAADPTLRAIESALRNHEVLSIAGLRRTISARDEALRQLREAHAATKADNARMRATLASILDVTAETHVDGVTRERPYTALSRISAIAREGVRGG